MTTGTSAVRSMFSALSADDADNQLTEIDSLCMNCYQQGRTRLLLTTIPYYKDVILSSFECESCHFKNNDIQSAQRIESYGIMISVQVLNNADLNRQFVKSSYGTIRIKELDFEQAPIGENGLLTTIEGFLSSVVDNLQKTVKQIDENLVELSNNTDEESRLQFQDQKQKLLQFIERVDGLRNLSQSFHFEIDDPSGNSFIENPKAPRRDEQMVTKQYRRSAAQKELFGITEEEDSEETPGEVNPSAINPDDILTFSTNCPYCNAVCDTNMKLTVIPYFKEVIIMATSCDSCGHKSNEVKSGTGIAPKGIRYELKMTDRSDLNRDVLVSETATFAIPELDFELGSSKTIGGRFTTLEGIFNTLKEQLTTIIMPFAGGDSRDANSDQNHVCSFVDQILAILSGEKFVTVVVSDPAGSCYLQNVYAPDPDPNLKVEQYERSEEENELLGLSDMNVDHYQ